ncbi:methylmalonyl-CoA mutase family protein [Gracilimonas sp. Q87]|uniref:methylmalonyl-CoA mutase family protein n=1 Tax=Gracilimonas sp. Q87 TaxID=3384766 RepID=UPI0039845916
MNDLNFEDELNFNEFPPVSTEKWEEIIRKDLKGKDYKEILRWDTREGIDSLPFYQNEDLNRLDRSTEPLTHTGNWSVLEVVEDAKASDANKQALLALENGAGGLDLRLSTDRIASKKDLESLFESIQIDIITIIFGPSVSSPEIIGWVSEIISERNLDAGSLDMHFSTDIFSHAAVLGNLPEIDVFKNFIKEFNSVSGSILIDTSTYANAGATLVQQLAFALSVGNEYLGSNPELAKSLSFKFSTGTLYFPEIAKYRAFRLLWDQILSEYNFSIGNVKIFSETALWNKAQNDPYNNMLRATTESMSAALGGCDGISVHRFDKHFKEQTPFATRIARNTQLILQEEAYLGKVSDPGAGSYYIEVLTEKMAEESWKLFQEIEAKGGFYECLRSGFIQELISDARNKKIQAYKEEKEALIGVNKYKPDEETDISNDEAQQQNMSQMEFSEVVKITPIKPLNIEAELKKGDA